MLKRVVWSVLAYWVLLAAPVLCLGGIVVHQCARCAAQNPCGHEAGCEDDPCSVTPPRSGTNPDAVALAGPAANPDCMQFMGAVTACAAAPNCFDARARRAPARFFDTGLPLLN